MGSVAIAIEQLMPQEILGLLFAITVLFLGPFLSMRLGLRYYVRRTIAKLTSDRNLAGVVNLHFDASKLNWSVDRKGIEAHVQRRSFYSFGTIVGLAYIAAISVLIILSVKEIAEAFAPIGWLVLQSGIAFFVLISRYSKQISAKIENGLDAVLRSRIMPAFDSTIGEINELRKLEASLRYLAGQLRIAFPSDYVTEAEQHIHSHLFDLVFERAGFSHFMNVRLQSAHKDNEELERALHTIQEMEKLYLETAREVNRTNSISMITESDWLGNELLPESLLMSLLVERKWSEFHQGASMIQDEMVALKERAARHREQPPESREAGCEPSKMTKEKALDVLGVSGDVTLADIEKLRRQFAKIYHEDLLKTWGEQSQKADGERHKEINAACDFLEAELHATAI